MRKKIVVFLCILLSLSLLSCTAKRKWHFEKPHTDVKKISLIYINYDNNINSEELIKKEPIKIIGNECAADIYYDVANLKQDNIIRFTYSEPYGYCVLMDYGNEYYCIISQTGSGVIHYDIKYDNYIFSYSKIGFDKESFEIFINKYK